MSSANGLPMLFCQTQILKHSPGNALTVQKNSLQWPTTAFRVVPRTPSLERLSSVASQLQPPFTNSVHTYILVKLIRNWIKCCWEVFSTLDPPLCSCIAFLSPEVDSFVWLFTWFFLGDFLMDLSFLSFWFEITLLAGIVFVHLCIFHCVSENYWA